MQLPFLIRDAGQRLFRNVPVRIRSGMNENMKWSIVTTGRGYGSGSFGVARLAALEAVVRPGDCVWDVGAHKGFVSLAASRMVGRSGSVVAIEPSPRNRWFVRRHLSWNHIENVTVLPLALSGERGEARFGGRGDSLAYTLGTGDETVAVRTVPDVVEEHGVPAPDVWKIDAEGQEAEILRSAGPLLKDDAALLVSVHGPTLHHACTALFQERGFTVHEGWEMAACSADPERPWTSDYDLLAFGPERDPEASRLATLELLRGP